MHGPNSHMGAWGLPASSPVNKVPGELPIDCDFVLEVAGHRDWHLTFDPALAKTWTGTYT